MSKNGNFNGELRVWPHLLDRPSNKLGRVARRPLPKTYLDELRSGKAKF